MILDNGVIRTMDPSLPTCGRARDRRATGRRRCRHPRDGAPDARARRPRRPLRRPGLHATRTSTSRRGRSPAARCGSRARASLDEALARVAAPSPRRRTLAPRARLARAATGPRRADARRRSTRSPGDVPVALWSKDYHSLWLNSAALALRGRRPARCRAASSSATTRGEPTGVLREESAWRFRDRFVTVDARTSGSRRRARAIRLANARGVTAVHDKDGWLGAPAIFQRHPRARGPDAAGLAVAPGRARSDALAGARASARGSATTSSGSAT